MVVSLGAAATESNGDMLSNFQDFLLTATVRILPRLAHVCHIRSTPAHE